MRRTLLALTAVSSLTACNAYDYFRLTGYQQESFTNKADVLFVIDNSGTMVEEAEGLATNFASFIETFADENPPTSKPTLADEVGRFLEYIDDRTANVNYHLGITTTEVYADVGRLTGRNPVLTKTDENVPKKFVENLVCDAACVPTTPSVQVNCPGDSSWGADSCATGAKGSTEEPIEAVFMAMCRAVDNPPPECFQNWWWDEEREAFKSTPPSGDTGGADTDVTPDVYFSEGEVGTNGEWLREGSVVIPVIVSDEGDQSRRISGRTGDVFPYPELFRAFNHRMTWAVIGPDPTEACGSQAAGWGVQRYQSLVNNSNGVYVNITNADDRTSDGLCKTADFEVALTEIGRLLRGLADTFPLRTQPVPGTIVVEVNGQAIEEAEGRFDEDLQQVVFDDGWVYDASSNAVVLKGDVIPEFDADVRVWYLPAQGTPRDLPF